MSDEAQVRCSLQIVKDPLEYQSKPTMFYADVAGIKGPVPGAFTAAVAPGTDVDLSELTAYGLCRIMNLDDVNFVDYGIWDTDASKFYPIHRVLAGETYVARLCPDLGGEYGSGTGTAGSGCTMRFRADTAAVDVIVEAFEA